MDCGGQVRALLIKNFFAVSPYKVRAASLTDYHSLIKRISLEYF